MIIQSARRIGVDARTAPCPSKAHQSASLSAAKLEPISTKRREVI
jgi:hypothetical protein